MRPKKKAVASRLVDGAVFKILKEVSVATLPASDDVSTLIFKISIINRQTSLALQKN